MAATKTTTHLRAIAERKLLDFDPNATAATIVDLVPGTSDECIPVKNLERLLVGVFRSVASSTPDVSSAEIFAATDGDGTGATTVVAMSGIDPDAVGDTFWLECDIEMIREVLATATHVGVKIAMAGVTAECVVYYEAHRRFDYNGQTANYIA